MRRITNSGGFDPAKAFFSMPLAQARGIASQVAAPVVAQAIGAGELLNELLNVSGHEVLRDALASEIPSLSVAELFSHRNLPRMRCGSGPNC